MHAQPAAAQTADGPKLQVARAIEAEPATRVAFPIRVGRAPRHSFVRVRGLPAMAALSDGYSIAPGSWAVPLRALASLKITLPAAVAGQANVVVTLVGSDGSVLSEARTTLRIAATRPGAGRVAPVPTAADRRRALEFLRKGDGQLAEGLVASARLFYERAADLGLARAAMAMAGTYDPVELDRPHLRSVQPDMEQARRWYARARDLGARDAEARLRRLN